MEEFYDQLWRKQRTPVEALRRAQLAVLNDPERVRKRAVELRKILARQGVSDAEMERRGIRKQARLRPPQALGKERECSPVAWWAGFVVSGPP
jgi:CHAT domain-containing protein